MPRPRVTPDRDHHVLEPVVVQAHAVLARPTEPHGPGRAARQRDAATTHAQVQMLVVVEPRPHRFVGGQIAPAVLRSRVSGCGSLPNGCWHTSQMRNILWSGSMPVSDGLAGAVSSVERRRRRNSDMVLLLPEDARGADPRRMRPAGATAGSEPRTVGCRDAAASSELGEAPWASDPGCRARPDAEPLLMLRGEGYRARPTRRRP